MNTESVVEFLGNVPLLRRLPSYSLKRIAQVVVFSFMAQVLRSAGEENCSELLLRHDLNFEFFGRGIFGDTYSADVVGAQSESFCRLVLHFRDYRNKVATGNIAPWPVDIRFCDPNYSTQHTKSPPRLKYWFKAKGQLSDDQTLHRCVVAFASDLIFACVSVNPHRRKGMAVAALSLDHSIWFHRPLRADDWLLFVMGSPTGSESSGFATGEKFNRKGELVVSLTQEAVTIKPTFGAKL